MSTPAQVIEQDLQAGFQNAQQRKQQLEDEQRKVTLKTLQEDADNPADKVAAIQAVYHKDPGVLKQHVENLTRRLTGQQAQPVTPPQQAQQGRLAPIVARGKTPAQQDLNQQQASGDIANKQSLGLSQAEAQQKQQQVFALIDQYIKDPAQNKTVKEDYVRRQAAGTVRPTTDELKRQDYQSMLLSGQAPKDASGNPLSYEAWVAQQSASGHAAGSPEKGPQGKTAGTSNGKNVFAFPSKSGWVDVTGNPVPNFRPMPSYAQVAPTMRAVQVVDPNDPNSTIYESIPKAIATAAQGTQSTGYKTRAAVQKAFTTGTPAQNITSINTLRGHLSLLKNAATALQNGDTQLFNTWSQRYAQQTGSPAPTNFESMKTAVASELARTLTGKGATVQEIAQIQEPLSIADSPEQFAGAIDTFDRQMGSRLEALQQQYQSGMEGKPAFNGAPAPKKGATGDKSVDDFLKNF